MRVVGDPVQIAVTTEGVRIGDTTAFNRRTLGTGIWTFYLENFNNEVNKAILTVYPGFDGLSLRALILKQLPQINQIEDNITEEDARAEFSPHAPIVAGEGTGTKRAVPGTLSIVNPLGQAIPMSSLTPHPNLSLIHI